MINEVVKWGLEGKVVSKHNHPYLSRRISRNELMSISLMERKELEALVRYFEVELPRSLDTYGENALRTVILEQREEGRKERRVLWYKARREYRKKVRGIARIVNRTIELM